MYKNVVRGFYYLRIIHLFNFRFDDGIYNF